MPQELRTTPLSVVQRVMRAKEFWIFLFLLSVYLFLFILKPHFRRLDNQLIVVRQFSWIAIIAVGMTMVIITAGIDLSVGSVLALSACSMGKLVEHGMNVWAAVALGLLIGAACGFLNGLTVTKLKIPPFIATLGMMGMARGATFVVTRSTYSMLPAELVDSVGRGSWLGVPVPVLIMAAVAVAGSILLRHTTMGRYIYAIGGNEEAARLSGIRVDRVKLAVYSITGLLAGLGGMVLAARSNTAQPTFGLGSELNVIAAVIVGGTSLMGGEGSVPGTVIGAAILGIIPCALILFYIPADWQYIAVGAVIIIAVALDQLKKR
jgi:ribose transport system permease protein